MKVLLFVQTGDARPVSTGAPAQMGRLDGTLSPFSLTHRQARRLKAAARWWLVACENADAGRALIHAAELVAAARRFVGRKDAPACISGRLPEGRILASGGRHA